ncbi:WD repeat-containing protein 93-like [Watersipora subatra]|uniref:WD repeat-containing protein 93-like n=1 Tax=Watersipora subatra TaxID=2589382 RepID=UPI00355BCB97
MALIIKSLGVDPPNYDELSDDEDDFVKDPSQFRAALPQPYRFVDEVLSLFIDEVWEEITFKENEKAVERAKVRPPKYECAVEMQEHTQTKALAASHDGRYLFIASSGELSILDASKKKVLYKHENEHLDLHTLICCIIGVEIYLLVGLDEQGVCHVFSSADEKIFEMKVLNEDVGDKFHVTKCQPSSDGDYLGLVAENPTNSDVMLEVYSFPRDSWLKEIEDIKAKLHQSDAPKLQEAVEPGLEEKETEEPSTLTTGEGEEEEVSGRKSVDSVESKKGYNFKFTAANLVMRQHRPDKLQANQGISPSAALKELSDPKLILGSGHGHLLTRPYIDIRQEAFDELHRDKVMYKLTESVESSHLECNFHFFTPGLAIPYGIEQPGALKKPTSIGVWWSGSCQFIYYSLTRPVKVKKTAGDSQDAELDIKPETVWPQASVISASAVSPDSALVAIGLTNGLVTVWDKYLCCVRKSVLISKLAITNLDFMEPSICPQFNNRQRSYPTTTSCYILVRCADSSLHLLNCGPLDNAPPITIANPSVDDDHVITAIDIFPAKCPEVILKVHKNGTMFLQDVISAKTLCEIALPTSHELTTPWQPVMSISAFGQMLYIKGSQRNEEESEKSASSLFVFQFRSFPALDSYWVKSRPTVPYLTASPIETRVAALLRQRVKTSGERQQRLQKRWPLMKQEAIKIAQIKSH